MENFARPKGRLQWLLVCLVPVLTVTVGYLTPKVFAQGSASVADSSYQICSMDRRLEPGSIVDQAVYSGTVKIVDFGSAQVSAGNAAMAKLNEGYYGLVFQAPRQVGSATYRIIDYYGLEKVSASKIKFVHRYGFWVATDCGNPTTSLPAWNPYLAFNQLTGQAVLVFHTGTQLAKNRIWLVAFDPLTGIIHWSKLLSTDVGEPDAVYENWRLAMGSAFGDLMIFAGGAYSSTLTTSWDLGYVIVNPATGELMQGFTSLASSALDERDLNWIPFQLGLESRLGVTWDTLSGPDEVKHQVPLGSATWSFSPLGGAKDPSAVARPSSADIKFLASVVVSPATTAIHHYNTDFMGVPQPSVFEQELYRVEGRHLRNPAIDLGGAGLAAVFTRSTPGGIYFYQGYPFDETGERFASQKFEVRGGPVGDHPALIVNNDAMLVAYATQTFDDGHQGVVVFYGWPPFVLDVRPLCYLAYDFNFDGRVDLTDLMLIARLWRAGVRVSDVQEVAKHWGETCPPN